MSGPPELSPVLPVTRERDADDKGRAGGPRRRTTPTPSCPVCYGHLTTENEYPGFHAHCWASWQRQGKTTGFMMAEIESAMRICNGTAWSRARLIEHCAPEARAAYAAEALVALAAKGHAKGSGVPGVQASCGTLDAKNPQSSA